MVAVVTAGAVSAHRTLAALCTRHEGRNIKLVRLDFDLHCNGVGAEQGLGYLGHLLRLSLLLLRPVATSGRPV